MHIQEVNEEDPEGYVIKLYNKASKYIWTSTSLNPEFYNRPKIIEAITNAVKRVESFHLIYDAVTDWNEIKEKVLWLSEFVEKGKIKVRESLTRLSHWLIVDGSHFRLEKKHEHINVLKLRNLIVWDANTPVADKLTDMFAGWWHNATPIE